MPKPPDPKRPVVCFDESPTQLIGEVRQPIPAAPGQPERYDYEYRRNGTANLFVFLDAHRPWRKVKVTERRTADDFAALHARPRRCPLSRGGAHPGRARQPLNPHRRRPLCRLPGAEARRVLRRLEFHYIPKHASWLNMVEIEIGVLQANASIAASTSYRRARRRDRRLGESDATPNAHASNGCSQPKKPAPKWRAPIRSLMPNQPAKNQNL